MLEAVLDHVRDLSPISPEAEADLVSSLEVLVVDKNEELLREGQVCNKLFFILEGTVRVYMNLDGRDTTYWIYPENEFFSSWNSFLDQSPSKESVQSIEKTKLCYLTHTKLEELYEKHPSFDKFGRKMFERHLSRWDDFYKGFPLRSAKEKYEHLLAAYPSVTQRANLGYIATMLGISPETLSRIRRG